MASEGVEGREGLTGVLGLPPGLRSWGIWSPHPRGRAPLPRKRSWDGWILGGEMLNLLENLLLVYSFNFFTELLFIWIWFNPKLNIQSFDLTPEFGNIPISTIVKVPISQPQTYFHYSQCTYFPARGTFVPSSQRVLGNVWTCFLGAGWGGAHHWHLVGRGVSVKHPTILRTVLHNK